MRRERGIIGPVRLHGAPLLQLGAAYGELELNLFPVLASCNCRASLQPAYRPDFVKSH
jgi:hypothetical protein